MNLSCETRKLARITLITSESTAGGMMFFSDPTCKAVAEAKGVKAGGKALLHISCALPDLGKDEP